MGSQEHSHRARLPAHAAGRSQGGGRSPRASTGIPVNPTVRAVGCGRLLSDACGYGSSPASSTVVKTLEQDADECYQSVLLPINERMMGPLPQSEIITSRPMVLLLGNHSSGKSSFVNFLVEAEVQKSGVAPTDDCFTLIVSGPEDTDQDGPALVGDPDFGFMGLRNFGNALISHTQLKVRKNLALKNVILVDSPGMIDCPAVSAPAHRSTSEILRQGSNRLSGRANDSTFDRGYNFMAVTRWFAEHSDVILLFFDPDKPGTTGETLECLTKALSGMEHKLNIIFNKCDQFSKMHDFARAFGALCWNLSKVCVRTHLCVCVCMCVRVCVCACVRACVRFALSLFHYLRYTHTNTHIGHSAQGSAADLHDVRAGREARSGPWARGVSGLARDAEGGSEQGQLGARAASRQHDIEAR